MKLKKLALGLLACTTTYAVLAAPIENVSLSQNNSSGSGNNTTTNSPSSNIPTNVNWELMQRVDQLENQVRSLRGIIEEQQHAIDQQRKDLDNHYNDLDQRLQLLQQKVDGDDGSAASDTASSEAASSNSETATSTTPSPSTATNNATSTSTGAPPAKKPLNEKDAYTLALDAYKQGGAKQAIKPMQDFIKKYPNSIYIGNAHFWLAEFYLAIEPANYTEAKKNYEVVYKQYPQSAKASRALYQLYSIAKNVDHNSVSANLYRQQLLKQYPKSTEAGYLKKP
ncbi:YbgF trimerization domain-containing protein [Acinetobacter sp. ANC 4641]|uniref:YbgF trimerization domain-containing protein n=1 Tax=Acinetobacter sp. ANC 4641 TaxID=2529847 RepID=UPI00103D971E|nr:YbgF trimerization domain-containing protein [Acinetobacter sp. ANC 4641]TCB11052.1 tetratricopeptide repeat protein [Acinetobacter sp. ANC 4641]